MARPKRTLASLTLGSTIELKPTEADARQARCANRAACFYAQAIDRQFDLGGHGYIKCDANEFSFSCDGRRYHFHPTKAPMTILRRFDEIGQRQGEEAARNWLLLHGLKSTNLKFVGSRAVTPTATRERKDQINVARNKRNAELRLQGQSLARRPRYAGV